MHPALVIQTGQPVDLIRCELPARDAVPVPGRIHLCAVVGYAIAPVDDRELAGSAAQLGRHRFDIFGPLRLAKDVAVIEYDGFDFRGHELKMIAVAAHIDGDASRLPYFTAIAMNRRTLLRWLPFPALRAWAQTTSFPGKYGAILRELAAVALPSELGRTGTDRVAEQFERWVREYRPGADMDHGYGFTRVRSKPPAPAPAYLIQLEALREPMANRAAAAKRRAAEEALERANIKDPPRSPDGKHVISDLMTFDLRCSTTIHL